MAAINKGNEIEEITKKFEDIAEPQGSDSSCPPSSSRNKSPQLSELQGRDIAEEMVLKFRRAAEHAYSEYGSIIYNEIRNKLSAPIIIAMKGHQDTGRRLGAFYVASLLKCPIIKEQDFDNYEEKSEENQAKLWRNICSLALTQLTLGRCVVIDTGLAKSNEFDQLKELSKLTNTLLAVFEFSMESVDTNWDLIVQDDLISHPVQFIFDEFVNKPTLQYINSTNFNMGEIPVVLLGASFHWNVFHAMMDLRAHIDPTFHLKNTDCNHKCIFICIKDEYKILCCQCRQLVSGSVYRCQYCRIIFHQTCSYFPQSLQMSNTGLILYIRYVNLESDGDAKCKCCKQLIRSSTSSRYYSTADGNIFLDLECLFLLPAKRTAKIHEHELYRRIACSPTLCNQCTVMISKHDICYSCKQCTLWFHVYCAWLPETVQFTRDRHPLKLTVLPRVDSDPYYCHSCEEERDTDHWIYYCEDCDYEAHPRCILETPCLPRFSSTEISTTNKKLKEKFINTESHSCSSNFSTEKVMVKELPLRVRSEAEEWGVLFKESTKEIKLPLIIMMKGHSTGRKLVARTLAATFDCLLIVEDSLSKDTCIANEPKLVCYKEFSQIALSQLQIGLSVVIDCDLSHESEFVILRDFAVAKKTPLFVVEFKLCDEIKMQDFQRIVRSDYEYDVGDTPNICVDLTAPTFDHIEKSMPHILHSISVYCKELRKEYTHQPEIPSCYIHSLIWEKNDDVIEGEICNGCSKQLFNPVLRCKHCPLVLHKTCTRLPLRIIVSGCAFNLEKYGNDNDNVRCDFCNELLKDLAYVSLGIVICVDFNCFLMPSKPGINLHEHPLTLGLSFVIFQCGACCSTRKNTLHYYCDVCDFNIGVRCGWLKETVSFDRHCHPFQLIVSLEHVSNQYYCEVCGEERDKDHWVYCCIECDYFIHVRCIGLPETAYCPPSHYYDDESGDESSDDEGDSFSVHSIKTHLLDMAESAPLVPSAQLLEWPKKDNHRFLHVVYRVGDLDRTIKFYTECFGMKLLRKRRVPQKNCNEAFLGFGPEESNFAVQLKYNYGVKKYDIGTGFGHFAIATPDVYKLAKTVMAKGGNIIRKAGPVKGESSVIAFAKDPDGYIFKLIQRDATSESLCQVMLRVGNLDDAIMFYKKALGMKMLRKIDRPEQKYTLAMMGYAEESETTVLELTYNYGVTEYTKGNAYKQIVISTQDVYKSGEVVNLVTQELRGKATRQPGPLPGINTKITAFLNPEGWKTVLVDNEYFLKELTKEWDWAKHPFTFYDSDE